MYGKKNHEVPIGQYTNVEERQTKDLVYMENQQSQLTLYEHDERIRHNGAKYT